MREDTPAAMVFGFMFGIFAALMAYCMFIHPGWKHAAVQHGAAHCDPQTGEWRWNDQKPEATPNPGANP